VRACERASGTARNIKFAHENNGPHLPPPVRPPPDTVVWEGGHTTCVAVSLPSSVRPPVRVVVCALSLSLLFCFCVVHLCCEILVCLCLSVLMLGLSCRRTERADRATRRQTDEWREAAAMMTSDGRLLQRGRSCAHGDARADPRSLPPSLTLLDGLEIRVAVHGGRGGGSEISGAAERSSTDDSDGSAGLR
jgi:hypothetical protein